MKAAVAGNSRYILLAYGLTAPDGKQFKGWAKTADGTVISDTSINVSENITLYAIWEDMPAATVEYVILEGANSKWHQGSDEGLSVRGSGEFTKLVDVKVDGKSIDINDYTIREGDVDGSSFYGTTIVALKADYLNSCSLGSHTLILVWTDGAAGTEFAVKEKKAADSTDKTDNIDKIDNLDKISDMDNENDIPSSQPAGNGNMWIWIALISIGGVIVLLIIIDFIIKKKKRAE